jgi:hypothetical protein
MIRFNDLSRMEVDANLFDILEKRFDYDADANVIYIGYNQKSNAPTSEESWLIFHMEYTTIGGDDYIERFIVPNRGQNFIYSWDDRATYF